VSHVPPGTNAVVTPYICPRNAADAIDWYCEVFEATQEGDRYVEPNGAIGHAQINIDGAQIMISDTFPDYGAVAPEPGNTAGTFALSLYVPDADATVAEAQRRGANVQRPVAEQFYGSRMGTLVDPFGVRWMIGTHVRDVSEEEMAKAAAEYSGAESGPEATKPG